jgi:uncharacterized caspase-like protein
MKKLVVRVTLRIILVATIAVAVIGGSVEAWAERRVALVVGNATYKATPPLANPRNDAEDVSNVLKTLGFEVVTTINANKRDMDFALQKFARLATDADSALFFYAGHAMQFQGRNFLLPTDAELEDEISVRYQTVGMEDVRAALDRANGVKIMILDACRNNPIATSLQQRISGQSRAAAATTRGLARVDKTQGMVVAYATAADDVAQDGTGRNSPFTTALLKRLQEPGLEIEQMFRRVAADVNTQTGGKQRPETTISLLSDYFLNQSDRLAWDSIKDRDDLPALRDFITKYPSSPLAIIARNRLDLLERFAREREKEEADRRARDDEQRRKVAEAEAQRRLAEAEAQRKREADAEVARKLAETEAKRKQAEAEAQQRREAEAEAKRKLAEAEAQRKREADAETQRKQAEAAAEAQRKLADAETKRKLAEAEAQQRREAEAEAKRKLAEAEAQRKREAEAEAQRKQIEAAAEAQRKREAEAEGKRQLAEADAQRKQAEADTQRKREEERLAVLDLQRQDERRRIEDTCRREEAKLSDLKAAGAEARDQLVKFQTEVECKALRPFIATAIEALPVPRINLPDQIREAQVQLKRLGCFPGGPDGSLALTDKTRKAVREFWEKTNRPFVDVSITDDLIDEFKRQQEDVCSPKKPPSPSAPVANNHPTPPHQTKPHFTAPPEPRTARVPPLPAAPAAPSPRPTATSTASKPPTALGTGF